MRADDVLKKAILTEKAHRLMEKGVYTFFVSGKASKGEVKNQVGKMFSVSVARVNMSRFAAKKKRVAKTRKTVEVGGGKKAIVYLAAGQTIPALSPKSETKEKKAKDSKALSPQSIQREKDTQQVQIEGKEG